MALVQVTVPYAKGYDFGAGTDLAVLRKGWVPVR